MEVEMNEMKRKVIYRSMLMYLLSEILEWPAIHCLMLTSAGGKRLHRAVRLEAVL
jgi:hypothetical protein